MTASIKLTTKTMDGCLILNKLGRRRVELCQRVMATLKVTATLLSSSLPVSQILNSTATLPGSPVPVIVEPCQELFGLPVCVRRST